MALQFLHGKNIAGQKIPAKPGTIYLDTATNELWYDDPDGTTLSPHNKIIDTGTLIYKIESTVTFPSESSGTTAVLGTAVLGTMVLGQE